MFRHTILAAALAALCLVVDGSTSGSAASQLKASRPEARAQSIAARWYYRARRGGLNKRSTPSGRNNSQTLRPSNLA